MSTDPVKKTTFYDLIKIIINEFLFHSLRNENLSGKRKLKKLLEIKIK